MKKEKKEEGWPNYPQGVIYLFIFLPCGGSATPNGRRWWLSHPSFFLF
jgi:hypothetical protein